MRKYNFYACDNNNSPFCVANKVNVIAEIHSAAKITMQIHWKSFYESKLVKCYLFNTGVQK